MIDESGQLSIDFLIGFTIFILGLIVVAAMVPGLLVGLQRATAIDYDAVAYRTGAILVEDPGDPTLPRYTEPWELKDIYHKDEVIRFGLAVSRDTPNILSTMKIEKFFNDTFFSFDDYRNKAIFGDIPYQFSISLRTIDGQNIAPPIGSSLPENSSYGYIRRVVKIKPLSSATYNASTYNVSSQSRIPANSTFEADNRTTHQYFTVRVNFTELSTRKDQPEFEINPKIEQITINITNINTSFNQSISANLTQVGLWKNGITLIPMGDQGYRLSVNGAPYTSLMPNAELNATDYLYLELDPVARLPLGQNDVLDIRYNVTYVFPENMTEIDDTYKDSQRYWVINDTYPYSYTSLNVTQPALKPAVMEVAIW